MVQVKTEREVEATAWCELENDEGCRYKLQINNINGRAVRRVEKSCSEWRCSGNGWHPKTGYRTLIYSKNFKTQEEWIKWAKQFPYKLVELNSRGNPKRIKLGSDCLKNTRKPKRK